MFYAPFAPNNHGVWRNSGAVLTDDFFQEIISCVASKQLFYCWFLEVYLKRFQIIFIIPDIGVPLMEHL